METTKIVLDAKSHRIVVNGLKLEDEAVFDIIKEIPDAQREEYVTLALKLGLLALNRITTTGETEIVKLEFTKLKDTATSIISQLETRVGSIFDTDDKESNISKFIKELNELIDPEDKNSKLAAFLDTLSNMENINNPFSKFLNLNNETSPLALMKKDLVGKLQEIDTKLIQVLARREERELGSGKGTDFEDDVENYLLDIIIA